MKTFDFGAMALGTLLACAAASPAWANRYHLVDLGAVDTGYRINNHGVIAGVDRFANEPVYYKGGRWHTLPDGDAYSFALDVNDAGQFVGVEERAFSPTRAVLWQPDKSRVILDMPVHGWAGYAEAISNTGYIAGEFTNPVNEKRHCFVQPPQGGSIDLGGIDGGGDLCDATDVNSTGQVVGYASVGHRSDNAHAFLWQDGVMQDLGTLGGKGVVATGINDRGQVVGSSSLVGFGGPFHAFLWENGQMKDIGTSKDIVSNQAKAINGKGDIIGEGTIGKRQRTECVRFTGDGGIVRIADEVDDVGDAWLENCSSINDKGVIVGQGIWPDRSSHAYMLVPIDQ